MTLSKGWFSLSSDGVGVGVVFGVIRDLLMAYDQVKIENRSRRKRSHKLDGVGVGRIRTFPFLPIPFTTPSLIIQCVGMWSMIQWQ